MMGPQTPIGKTNLCYNPSVFRKPSAAAMHSVLCYLRGTAIRCNDIGCRCPAEGVTTMANEIETRLVHDGEPRSEGAVGVPIFQSSTFLTRGDERGYDDIRYIRLNN